MNKTKKNKKGGDSNLIKYGNFIPFNKIKQDEVCAICQEPLKNSKQITETQEDGDWDEVSSD